MLYSELYTQAFGTIKATTPDYPQKALEIQILIERSFNLSRTQFWMKKQSKITDKNGLIKFYRYLKRLNTGEPLAYILRERHFFSETFYINRNVLIPRPDTELLVEKALESMPHPAKILEIGAGCGNIAISIATRTHSRVVATEKSKKAFYVLKKNIHLHHLEAKVLALNTDLFPENKNGFNLIISNPPYISEKEWNTLPINIKNFEPRLALVAGPAGIEIIEKIILKSPSYLKPSGLLLLEIGYNQKKMVNDILRSHGFRHIHFYKDINRIDRVASARR